MSVAFSGFELDPSRFELRHQGVPVPMEPQVYDVLSYLVQHRDRVVPKEELLDEIWGDRFVSESALTSRIKAARRALGDDGATQRFIETRRGRGYRFVATIVDEPSLAPAADGAAAEEQAPVVFLLSDIDESTGVWVRDQAHAHRAMAHHDALMRRVVEQGGGEVFAAFGGTFNAAFATVDAAVAAATEAQRTLGASAWPDGRPAQVRMGLHIGGARRRGGNFLGPAVHTAERILSAGRGGQVLASAALAAIARLECDVDVIDLGEHRLRDLSGTERLFQIGGGSFPPLRTLELVRHNLPVQRTVLVGRESEIEQVAALVETHRLVTLLGIGGTGKTRLATAVAADRAERFDDGVWFVDLVPVATREQVAEAIAVATGLQLNQVDVIAALAALIDQRKMLIVLDNCEHITELVAEIADELLARTCAPRLLATSREPLQLADERQVRVAPLAVDNGMVSPAVQLFAAAAERVGAIVDDDQVDTIAFICAHLDGLPLSIELAAAQLRHLRLDELAARLDQRFEILARGHGGRVRRQASLQAVLEDTWGMLDGGERDLLLQLAAFASSFSVDDVEEVANIGGLDAPARLLAGLVDRGLVARDGEGRHRLLETVKLFARQRWALGEDPEVHLERHTAWVIGHLQAFTPEEWYTSFRLLSWSRAHYDDHRAVEDRLLKAGRGDELVALLRSLTQTYGYETGTRASAVIERIDTILHALELSPRQQGVLHVVASNAGLPARRPDRIESSSAAAVRLLRDEGEPIELAAALIVGSWMTVFRDFEGAVAMLEEAATTATAAAATALADVALGYLAGHHALVGRIEESVELLADVGRRLEGRPFDYAGSIHRLYTLAVHVVDAPELSRAEGERMIAEFAELSVDGGIGWGLPISTCVVVAASGDIAGTQRLVAEVESLNRRSGNADGLPDLLLPAAALAWRLGQDDLARRWLSAVRRSPKPTQNFHLTIMYRLLRREVGVTGGPPLSPEDMAAVYAETVAWMRALDPLTPARPVVRASRGV